MQCDIGSEPSVVGMLEEVDSTFGSITALVNNAATLEAQMRLDSMTAERVSWTMAVNVLGPLMCAREAVRRMSTKRGGRGGAIVNVSPGAAKYGSPGEYVDYAATKEPSKRSQWGSRQKLPKRAFVLTQSAPASSTQNCTRKVRAPAS